MMAHASPQIFDGITPAQYELLVHKARAAGIEMKGDSGRASRMGVEVEWQYSPEKQELTLTCLRTPFFVSAEDVNARLRAVVNAALKA